MKKRNNYLHINLILFLKSNLNHKLILKILDNNTFKNLYFNQNKKKYQKKKNKKINIYIYVELLMHKLK